MAPARAAVSAESPPIATALRMVSSYDPLSRNAARAAGRTCEVSRTGRPSPGVSRPSGPRTTIPVTNGLISEEFRRAS